jgi:hypothetical protein
MCVNLRIPAWIVAATVLVCCSVADAHKPPRNKPADPKIQGTYTLAVTGDFKGSGSLQLEDRKLSISCQLTDSQGNKLTLSGSDLSFSDGRFFGTAQLGGKPIDLSGRVDLPDQSKGVRVTALFRSADNQVGRITNTPKPASDDSGDDDSSDKREEHH